MDPLSGRADRHALAYNVGNFMRTLATPKAAESWSLTSLREKLIKIGAKVVSHGRYVTFQMAEVAVSRLMFGDILMLIARLRGAARTSVRGAGIQCDKHDGGGAPWRRQATSFMRHEAGPIDSAACGTYRG